ncbi:hypothetical protein GBA52_005546 [Prunus armeniaca]|nr:hypothetical protein GBA52_005546 [Prunus armeniaca]
MPTLKENPLIQLTWTKHKTAVCVNVGWAFSSFNILRPSFKRAEARVVSKRLHKFQGSSAKTQNKRQSHGCHRKVFKLGASSERALLDPREEVIQAWFMDDSDEDQRLPHHREPKEFVSLDQLTELGVLSWRLDADNYETDEELKKIREERGYSYMDFCEVSPEKLPNYEEKIKSFFEEHLHTDEEIRYAVAGSGYFDVRDRNERWIRVWLKKGGLIVLPAGIYHRFTLDTDNYIKAMRLFVGDPVWTPFNRPHDHLPARQEYVKAFVHKETGDHAVDAAA